MRLASVDGDDLERFLRNRSWSFDDAVRVMGGGNRHQVYLLGRGDRREVLKLHAPPVTGRRDSFRHERLMHSFYGDHAPGLVPAMLASDEGCRALIFEHVEGEAVNVSSACRADARQMAAFLVATNRLDVLAKARIARLPAASDKGVSAREHWNCAASRLEALLSLPAVDEQTIRMQEFVRSQVRPALHDLARPCELSREVCLSPSDFGFHNVIRRPNGMFCFLDFEHAGWDDPAKLVADFLLQPEAPLSSELAESFLTALGNEEPFGPRLGESVRHLLPIQKSKWVTIILNVFGRTDATLEIKAARLVKAMGYWRLPMTTV